MKKIITLFLILNALVSFGQSGQIVEASFMYEGIQRDYQIYLPANYQAGVQWPLVFNLHGLGSNYVEQTLYSAMTAVADTANFIICHPNGTPNTIGGGFAWNVNFPLVDNTADDVGFINTLIDTIHANYNVNLGRVYSCGMSNGGYMSYKLACESTDRFQAIASVTGSMVPSEMADCMASSTIPVLQIHGTEDPTVAYDGSAFGVPIEDLITYWVNHNQCTDDPDTIFIEDSPAGDMSTAQLISYTDCETDREVFFYKIIGGEHTWPGAIFPIGVTNQDIKASIEIWNFFNKYGEDLPPLSNNTVANQIALDVHPNPVVDQLNISSDVASLLSLRVLNSLGQVVITINDIDNSVYRLNTNQLPTGVYFLDIQTDKGAATQQFLRM